jgi:cold shock CspA family protein
MPTGHVKWYSEKKGCGYIELDKKSDLFFSKCNIENDELWKPRISEYVSFEILETATGKQADSVKPSPL